VGIAAFTLREIGTALRRGSVSLPFWISFELSPGAVLWAAGLAVLAAAIIGILPALRATRGTVSDALRVVGSGASGLRLGATWTTLVVAQVAFAVALLPAAVHSVWESMRSALAQPGFAASECLTARLQIDHEPPGRLDELIRALEAQPAVSGVTFAAAMPGDEPAVRLEAENGNPAGHEVRLNRVGAGFFQTFGVPFRTGRTLTAADATAPGQPVVVNEALARSLFHGDALGRRVRIAHGPWREIVGVAADFPAAAGRGLADSTLHLYELAAPSTVEQPVLAVRLRRGAPVEFAAPLREIAARIDPEAELRDVLAMDEVLRREQWIRLLEGGVFAAVTLSVLLLSAAGIYALTSLTVSQRRKEIGIRTALGADPRRLLLGVFSRALRQLGLGAVLGMSGAAALEHALWGNLGLDDALRVLPVAAAILVGVGLLGVAGPARRSLRIAPSEALREE
jgi:putative ABC transport system permease protein